MARGTGFGFEEVEKAEVQPELHRRGPVSRGLRDALFEGRLRLRRSRLRLLLRVNSDLRAERGDDAALAIRISRGAYPSSVMDENVGEVDPVLLGNELHQFLLHLLRVLAVRETETVREAEDMGVHDEPHGDAESGSEDDVRGLAGDPGKRQKLFHRPGHLASKIGGDFRGRALDRFRLVPEEAGRADDLLDLAPLRRRRIRDGGIAGEESGGDHVHPHVGALRREDRGD